MSQGFAGDVALHLGLVNCVDGHPHDAATDHDSPESVTLQRIWVKTVTKVNKMSKNTECNVTGHQQYKHLIM